MSAMKWGLIGTLSAGTLQYFGVPAYQKIILIGFVLLIAIAYAFQSLARVRRDLFVDCLLALTFLVYNLIVAIITGVSIAPMVISLQFPIVLFALAFSAPTILSSAKTDFDQLVNLVNQTLFFSWSIFTLWGLVFLGDSLFWEERGILRLKGSLGVSPSAILNGLVCVSSIYLALKRIDAKVNWLLCLFSFLLVLASGTRIVMLALVVSLSTLLFFGNFRYRWIVIVIALPTVVYLLIDAIFSRLSPLGAFSNIYDFNFNGRLLLWEILMRNVDDEIVGQGPGSSISLLERAAVGTGVQPHNDFLRIFHDLGYLGLGIFSIVLINIYGRTIKLINTSPSSDRSEAAKLVFSLVVMFTILMATDNPYIYNFLFLPVLLLYYSLLGWKR